MKKTTAITIAIAAIKQTTTRIIVSMRAFFFSGMPTEGPELVPERPTLAALQALKESALPELAPD